MNSIENNKTIISEWKFNLIMLIKKRINRRKKNLIFIHVPKCAGSYASQYIDYLKIINKGHIQANIFDKFSFAIIRNPIDRYESLLNYRLSQENPRKDWPKRLDYLHFDKTKTLNDVLSCMSDKEIMSFTPYKTLKFWIKNVHLLITIDEFIPTLKLFGYNLDKDFSPANVSEKNRVKLNDENRSRLEKLYNEDMKIYEHWTRKE
jgi:hypothetical protein